MRREIMDFRRYFSQTSAYRNFDGNRLWPLNLLCPVETSTTISEQYFRYDANCKEIFLFSERQKGVIAFGQNNSLKKIQLQKKSLKLSERTQASRLDNKGAILELYKTVQCVIVNQ